MKLVDKIKSFENLDGLIQEIIFDKNSRDILSRRFPVRLIFLQSFDTFRILIGRLSSMGIDNYHIEKDLPHPDGWITKDSLINTAKSINKDTAIVPFSEIVRFYSGLNFRNFFNQLLLIENTDLSNRIYLPLIGIEERFEKDFFQDFTRKEESPPFWKISNEIPNSIKVFLSINDNLPKISSYEIIHNTEEWLRFWKKKSQRHVICYSQPLNLFYKNTLPDTIFTIEQFVNQKYLFEKIYNIEIPIEYVEEEINNWENLGSLIGKDFTTYIDFVKKYFKVTSLTINSVLQFWLKTEDTFEKWLLKHYVLSQNCLSKKYLFKVFDSLPDYYDHTLLKCLYQKIFSLDNIEEFVKDRYDLIKQYSTLLVINLSDEVKDELNGNIRAITDLRKALQLTTGLFLFEKLFIFESFVRNYESDLEFLTQRFPELFYYISDVKIENLKTEQEWVYEYASEYKKSKLSDIITDQLNEMLSKNNGNEDSFYTWYHSFDSIPSLLHINKVDKVIWIDALGIEWVSFLMNYLNDLKHDQISIKNLIGVSNLPSSTDQNRFSDTKYIQDFDNFIHKNLYSYPETIIKEMEEMKRIIDFHIIPELNQTIAIVSDHGLTAMSRLVESKKYGKDDSHEGRYIEIKDKNYTKDSDYIYYKSEKDQKNYLIALKHNSLGRKPLREVHGGCTPEEVLIPLIIISNKKDDPITEYSISIENSEISRKEPLISFNITPKPIDADIMIEGRTQKLRYNNSTNKWESIIDKSLFGELSVIVRVDKTQKTFPVHIVTGFIEEDLF